MGESTDQLVELIRRGRTDHVFDLLDTPDGIECLTAGDISPLDWFVYFGDVTAMKAAVRAGVALGSMDLDQALRHASFFGHFRMADFLILNRADVTATEADTAETALHSTLCKADEPYRIYLVRLLLAHGADPNARTTAGVETGAFMRDARTKGETPLHRAAAYADESIIECLIDGGADIEARDAAGDTPLSWASYHLRPASVLRRLTFGGHRISDKQVSRLTSDHGRGFGNGMDWSLVGDYEPESLADG